MTRARHTRRSLIALVAAILAAFATLILAAKAQAVALMLTLFTVALLTTLSTTFVTLAFDETRTSRGESYLAYELGKGYLINGNAFRSCPKKTITEQGPGACPENSQVARGTIRVTHSDGKASIKLRGFNGPGGGTLEIFASSKSGFLRRPVTLEAKLTGPVDPEYGPVVRIPIGRIQPAPEFREETGIRNFELQLGATREENGQAISYLVPPKSCSGKLLFRSTLVIGKKRFTDSADAPCPPAG